MTSSERSATQESTFDLFGSSSPEAGPARTSAWRDVVSAWVVHARASSSRSSDSSASSPPQAFSSNAIFGPGGSSWRTSLASCRRAAPAPVSVDALGDAPTLTLFPEETAAGAGPDSDSPAADAAWSSTGAPWVPSSGRWLNSGMASPTECWTLSTSESPSDAVASSLSDILETTGAHLLKYCLSPKAAAGILRRAERRRRGLPSALLASLTELAERSSARSD